MDPEELRRRIASFDRWHYRFDFGEGLTTPIFDETHINRHEQRVRYFFEPLARVAGGSLRGHRVLDLGCNAGFWSLKAIEAGADFVMGIDGRQMHVDQANLVFEAKGVDPSGYNFVRGNIFEYDFPRDFDVVLCLGLVYHVAKPVELFEIMSRVGGKLLVIDTNISVAPDAIFEVRHDRLEEPRHAVDYEIVLVPNRRALTELARQFGYESVPLALNVTDPTGMNDYLNGRRVAFICSDSVALDGLPREVWPPPVRRPLGARAKRALRAFRGA